MPTNTDNEETTAMPTTHTSYDIPEVTDADIDDYVATPVIGEIDHVGAWDALTIGRTVFVGRCAANMLSPERVTILHRFTGDTTVEVRVTGPTDRDPNGTINWPGCMGRDPEYAAVLATMLLAAGEIAPTLARKVAR